MKARKTLSLATITFACLYPISGYSLTVEEPQANLELSFIESSSFTDIDSEFPHGKKRSEAVLNEVMETFQKSANKYLPSGYKLKVEITDIDLAGDRSPLSSTHSNFRVYKDIYPPRIAFSYTIYSPSEVEIASGDAVLRDLAYNFGISPLTLRSHELAPYVNRLVEGWATRELKRAVAKTK